MSLSVMLSLDISNYKIKFAPILCKSFKDNFYEIIIKTTTKYRSHLKSILDTISTRRKKESSLKITAPLGIYQNHIPSCCEPDIFEEEKENPKLMVYILLIFRNAIIIAY